MLPYCQPSFSMLYTEKYCIKNRQTWKCVILYDTQSHIHTQTETQTHTHEPLDKAILILGEILHVTMCVWDPSSSKHPSIPAPSCSYGNWKKTLHHIKPPVTIYVVLLYLQNRTVNWKLVRYATAPWRHGDTASWLLSRARLSWTSRVS